jgi:hypothetical protein
MLARENLDGMTINERLSTLDLFEEFDRAARRRDREDLISILVQAHLTREQAKASVDVFLDDPAKYGF